MVQPLKGTQWTKLFEILILSKVRKVYFLKFLSLEFEIYHWNRPHKTKQKKSEIFVWSVQFFTKPSGPVQEELERGNQAGVSFIIGGSVKGELGDHAGSKFLQYNFLYNRAGQYKKNLSARTRLGFLYNKLVGTVQGELDYHAGQSL